MTWFRIDDQFDDHPKVVAAGNAAIGLWCRGGAYASKYSTDGFIPRSYLRTHGTVSLAHKLVAVGLWISVEGGYQMQDFLDYNPSAEQVKRDRAAAAERQRRRREGQSSPPVTGENGHAVSSAAPTRPARPARPVGEQVPTNPTVRAVNGRPVGWSGIDIYATDAVHQERPKNPDRYAASVRQRIEREFGAAVAEAEAEGHDALWVAVEVLRMDRVDADNALFRLQNSAHLNGGPT